MNENRRHFPLTTGWAAVLRWPHLVSRIAFLLIVLCNVISSVSGDNVGGSAGSSGCENLNPSQLARKLRDEGDFDTRYMAANLEEAVNRFPDLADAKFIRKADVYTCDAQCAIRTQQVRSTFAKYGQMPIPAGPADTGPSFADVRQVLEGHLGASSSSGGQWNGALFPDFSSNIPVLPQSQDNFPSDSRQPNQQFPPIPIDSGFPLALPTLPPAGMRTTNSDSSRIRTPRTPKARRTRLPQSEGGAGGWGFKWLTPGDLGRDQHLDDFDWSDSPAAGHSIRLNRDRRAAPVNSTSIGQGLKIRCSKKGEEEKSGLHLLCGSCRIIRELPSEYYPRYINEVSCSGQTCFDKASKGGGRCIEQLINFDILRNVGTVDCQKWVTYTIAVPVCCSCLMSDALAQYLMMPWSGQTLTTSRPGH